MNKKVLTLCVSALLAGGMFGTANASQWPTDTQYVLNTGKYHLIQQVAIISGSNWQAASAPYTDYYLSAEEDGTPLFSKVKDENAYWTITTDQKAGVVYYQFTNAKGKVLTYVHAAGTPNEEKITWFNVASTNSPIDINDIFYTIGGTNYFLTADSPIDTNNYSAEFSSTVADARGFDNVEIPEEVIPAADLNAVLKDGFGLLFGPGKDKEYNNLTGAEAFSGKITAEPVSGATGLYYFKRADGKYIVLSDDFIGEANSTLNGTQSAIYRGYNFKAVSKHAFDTEINKNNAVFTVYKSYDFNDTDSLIVTLPYAGMTTNPDEQLGELPIAGLNQSDPCPGLRVFVASSRNDDFLTTIEYAKANDRLAVQQDDAYNGTDINGDGVVDPCQVGALAPYIQFGMTNIVDFEKFAGKVWNITDVKGNVLAPDVNWVDADYFSKAFDPAAQIQLNKPEGQWLPYYTSEADYGFINRESGVKWNLQDATVAWVIRSTDTKDLYEVYTDKYVTSSNEAWEKIYIKEAEDAELGWTENGYANYKAATEALNGKYLTLTNGVTGETAYVGKDADDNVILTENKDEAIEFRVKDLLHNYTSHDGLQGVDTLQHITTYMGLDKNGNIDYNAKDTLQFYHYRLFEHFSEKYLTYDYENQKYILVGAVTDNNQHEDFRRFKNADDDADFISTFVLKEKPNNTYNLISQYAVEYDYCIVTSGVHTEMNPNAEYDNDMNASLYAAVDGRYMTEKMYGAFQTATLSNMAYIYNYNDNDRFGVVDIATPEYMTITDAQDTIKVSLQNFQNFYLYEQGINGTNFLGMNHVADVDDMKAAIYVDTAFVRNDTYRPQYLLAMNGRHVEPIYDSHPDHTIPHLLHADTTYGRFLVNMVDSAKAWKGSDKTNPYIWDKSNYYRLAFIDGIHTGDKLILNTAKAKTTIDLSNNNDKVCTFAFRYVDEDREGVKIETLYGVEANGTPIRGWLKYQNNVPVVTNDYDDAHVFLVDNTTTEAPTANEEISANAAVSVVATDGAVIVKGAEGKNVIVSTILGKVVANEVVNSDNETIAAPAGIVVVSVDGESFKVAVK